MGDDENPPETVDPQIEAKRRAAVLEVVDPDILIRFAIVRLREKQEAEATRHRANAITRLEEALLWLHGAEVL
jgi:hypothetical protein